VTTAMKTASSDFPEEVLLSELIPPDLLEQRQSLLGLVSVVPIVLVGSWLVLALLCFPLAGGLPGGTRWLGAVFLAAGLTTAVGSWAAGEMSYSLLAGLDAEMAVSGLTPLAKELIASLVNGLLATVRTTGLIAVAVGLGLYVVAGVAGRARATRAAAAQPAAPSEQEENDSGPDSQKTDEEEAG